MIPLQLTMFGIAVAFGFYFILCLRQLLIIRKEVTGVVSHRLVLLNLVMILLSVALASGLVFAIFLDVLT